MTRFWTLKLVFFSLLTVVWIKEEKEIILSRKEMKHITAFVHIAANIVSVLRQWNEYIYIFPIIIVFWTGSVNLKVDIIMWYVKSGILFNVAVSSVSIYKDATCDNILEVIYPEIDCLLPIFIFKVYELD